MAELAAVVDARMAVGVDNQVIVLADKRRKTAQIGLIAGRADHAVTPAIKAGDGPFELPVAVMAAIGDARAGRAGAGIPHPFTAAPDAIRLVGDARIAVGSAQIGRASCREKG